MARDLFDAAVPGLDEAVPGFEGGAEPRVRVKVKVEVDVKIRAKVRVGQTWLGFLGLECSARVQRGHDHRHAVRVFGDDLGGL